MSVITREEIPQARAAVCRSVRNQNKGRRPKTPSDVVVSDMVRRGLLPFHVRMGLPEALSLRSFLEDMDANWGESGALAPIDFNRTGSSGGLGFLPKGIATDASTRAASVLHRLHDWQLGILAWLFHSRSRINITLALFGKENGNGVSGADDAAQQGAGLINGFARSVMQFYPVPVMEQYESGKFKRLSEVPR